MRRIFTIGESLVDIIFRSGQPQAAKPGGAMLNSSVSLGRAGLTVALITEYACDDVGNLIDTFLRENNVGTDYISKFTDGKTALALAFLDDRNDAHYTFYKNYPEKRLDITLPELKGNDILLFGSIYSVTPEIRTEFLKIICAARDSGCLMIYDPNIRKGHLGDIEKFRPMIVENLRAATLVRGSDEDFINIFGTGDPDKTWERIGEHCGCMVYTASSHGVYVRTGTYSGYFSARKITPVSTIGAGDNFNAGLIAAFHEMGIMTSDIQKLEGKKWEKVISTALDFATNVCMSYDNYIDLAFASRYRSASRFQI